MDNGNCKNLFLIIYYPFSINYLLPITNHLLSIINYSPAFLLSRENRRLIFLSLPRRLFPDWRILCKAQAPPPLLYIFSDCCRRAGQAPSVFRELSWQPAFWLTGDAFPIRPICPSRARLFRLNKEPAAKQAPKQALDSEK